MDTKFQVESNNDINSNCSNLNWNERLSLYFVCQFCRHSFKNVNALMLHKRKEHTSELNALNLKCIIFEERFVSHDEPSPRVARKKSRVGKEANTFHAPSSNVNPKIFVDITNSNETVYDDIPLQTFEAQDCALPNPFILVEQMTLKPKQTVYAISASSQSGPATCTPTETETGIDNDDGNNLTTSNLTMNNGDSSNYPNSDTKLFSVKSSTTQLVNDVKIHIVTDASNNIEENQNGTDSSTLFDHGKLDFLNKSSSSKSRSNKKLSSIPLIDLTDDQISRFIRKDEIVALPNPYIRLKKLTHKQIESKLNSFNKSKLSIETEHCPNTSKTFSDRTTLHNTNTPTVVINQSQESQDNHFIELGLGTNSDTDHNVDHGPNNDSDNSDASAEPFKKKEKQNPKNTDNSSVDEPDSKNLCDVKIKVKKEEKLALKKEETKFEIEAEPEPESEIVIEPELETAFLIEPVQEPGFLSEPILESESVTELETVNVTVPEREPITEQGSVTELETVNVTVPEREPITELGSVAELETLNVTVPERELITEPGSTIEQEPEIVAKNLEPNIAEEETTLPETMPSSLIPNSDNDVDGVQAGNILTKVCEQSLALSQIEIIELDVDVDDAIDANAGSIADVNANIDINVDVSHEIEVIKETESPPEEPEITQLDFQLPKRYRTRSSFNSSRTSKRKINYAEVDPINCSQCNRDFYTEEDLREHEALYCKGNLSKLTSTKPSTSTSTSTLAPQFNSPSSSKAAKTIPPVVEFIANADNRRQKRKHELSHAMISSSPLNNKNTLSEDSHFDNSKKSRKNSVHDDDNEYVDLNSMEFKERKRNVKGSNLPSYLCEITDEGIIEISAATMDIDEECDPAINFNDKTSAPKNADQDNDNIDTDIHSRGIASDPDPEYKVEVDEADFDSDDNESENLEAEASDGNESTLTFDSTSDEDIFDQKPKLFRKTRGRKPQHDKNKMSKYRRKLGYNLPAHLTGIGRDGTVSDSDLDPDDPGPYDLQFSDEEDDRRKQRERQNSIKSEESQLIEWLKEEVQKKREIQCRKSALKSTSTSKKTSESEMEFQEDMVEADVPDRSQVKEEETDDEFCTTNVILLDPDPLEIAGFTVNSQNPIKCKLCSAEFISALNAKYHVEMCWLHNKKKHIICLRSGCLRTFKTPTELQRHTKVKHPTKNNPRQKFKCCTCGKEFLSAEAHKNHEEEHVIAADDNQRKILRPFVCDICDFAFKLQNRLEKHRRVHNTERTVKCQNCPRTFRDTKDLSKHFKRVHVQPQLKRKHKRKICTICGKSLHSKWAFDNHMRAVHTKETPFACRSKDCDKKFTCKTALENHCRKDHFEEFGFQKFQCTKEKCEKFFLLKRQLAKHLLIHSGEKPFKCLEEGCTRAFKNKCTLKEHSRSHTGEKPYQCDKCGNAYSQVWSFQKHIRVHENTHNKFMCHLCPRKFPGSWELKQHLIIHEKGKQYVCDVCGFKCITKANLKGHKKIHETQEVQEYDLGDEGSGSDDSTSDSEEDGSESEIDKDTAQEMNDDDGSNETGEQSRAGYSILGKPKGNESKSRHVRRSRDSRPLRITRAMAMKAKTEDVE